MLRSLSFLVVLRFGLCTLSDTVLACIRSMHFLGPTSRGASDTTCTRSCRMRDTSGGLCKSSMAQSLPLSILIAFSIGLFLSEGVGKWALPVPVSAFDPAAYTTYFCGVALRSQAGRLRTPSFEPYLNMVLLSKHTFEFYILLKSGMKMYDGR